MVQTEGGGCMLQWAERLLMEGQTEQWGDKWEERFKDGKGSKKVCIRKTLALLMIASNSAE